MDGKKFMNIGGTLLIIKRNNTDGNGFESDFANVVTAFSLHSAMSFDNFFHCVIPCIFELMWRQQAQMFHCCNNAPTM
jgi:hypothetical protein